jgi:Ca2+/Na+ antiporter
MIKYNLCHRIVLILLYSCFVVFIFLIYLHIQCITEQHKQCITEQHKQCITEQHKQCITEQHKKQNSYTIILEQFYDTSYILSYKVIFKNMLKLTAK